MDIYVVQQGDTIDSIAAIYGVTASRLIIDNGLENANNLVPGQTIVIVYPSLTYTVQAGDTLNSIASSHGIPLMQLIRNNPALYERKYIYPGETLIISYNTVRELTTNGFVFPYVKEDILEKALPYLTFLSVFNYRIVEKGDIVTYADDTNIIQAAKTYGTIPLLMISSLSIRGEPNIEVVYELLINKEYQDNLINNVILILQRSGYQGINLVVSIINESNQKLYLEFLTNFSNRMNNEGFLFFITLNPQIGTEDSIITFEKLDYGTISKLCYRLTFLQYYWGVNTGPPSPVSSIALLRSFMDYVRTNVTANNISLGYPLIAYDWALPYIPNISVANSLTINSAITLASDTGTVIQFDEISQTPYFYYTQSYVGETVEHIVWSLDARSINAFNDLIIDYDLAGSGVWNIMIYYQQMWTIIISRFDISKLIPDQLS